MCLNTNIIIVSFLKFDLFSKLMNIEFENNNESMLNVNESVDQYYRYKMEKLYVITTDAKGGTTIIRNIHIVSKAIYRTANDLKSFYSKYLGLNASIKNDELYIPGRFAQETLQKALQHYINNYILCSKCKSPETHPNKNKTECKCSACGHLM